MASVSSYLSFIIWLQVLFFCYGLNVRENKLQSPNERVPTLNTRPIIGVMAQATHGKVFPKHGRSYIAASYIKYLESSGARVVPIMNDLTEGKTEKLFNSINGVLFPGGGVNLNTSGYAVVGRRIIDLAKVAFDKGDFFPIWGTCLGFEFLSTLVSEDLRILSKTDSENLPLPLNLSTDYRSSKLFGGLEAPLAYFLSTAPTTINTHQYSLTTSSFNANAGLKSFFRILLTNNDRRGVEFVSTMEAVKYPIFATQWHPEKNSFEWTLHLDIPHQEMSVEVTQYMSNFFVDQARQNHHKFASAEEEQAALIYNYAPVYIGNVSSFEQGYFFNKPHDVRSRK